MTATQPTQQQRYQISRRVTLVGLFVNLLLAFVKILFGIVGRSSALFADGVHSLSDVVSDGMVLVAAKYAHKGTDQNHPYGHERIETLATVLLSMVLMVIGAGIAYDSFLHWWYQTQTIPSKFTLYVAIFSIVANEGIFQYTWFYGKRINSSLLKANAWHSRSDMLSSVIVLIGILGALMGYGWAEFVAALFVCYFILKMAIKWTYQAVSELIDEGVDLSTQQSIEAIIANVDGVESYHCLRSRKMAGKILIDVHLLVPAHATAAEGHYIGECVRDQIAKQIDHIKDITVHVDVSHHHDDGFASPETQLPSRQTIMQALNKYLLHNQTTVKLSDQQVLLYYHPAEIEIILLLESDQARQITTSQYWNNFSMPHAQVNVVTYQRQ